MAKVFLCPKCDGEMVLGFIPDFNYGDTRMSIGTWAEGQPQTQEIFFSHRCKIPKKRIPIGAFRCQGCGYLEFYADDEFAAK
jgi:predicted nucleic-acid-binding Zn-ribbon protein